MKIFILTLVFCLFGNHAHSAKESKVYVDERVELITITQLLFDYPLVGKAEIGYKKDVLDYFSKYKMRDASRTCNTLPKIIFHL